MEDLDPAGHPLLPLQPLLVTADQAAKVLNVSRSIVYDLMRSGALRSVKIGRLRRISVGALDEFVAHLEAR